MDSPVVGYLFAIIAQYDDGSGHYVATCPGVGAVHVEAETEAGAVKLATEAGRAVLTARFQQGDLPTSDTRYLRAMRLPKREASIVRQPAAKSTQVGTCLLPAGCQ